MTRTELRELIANDENSGVAFKEDTVDLRGLAKELAAFANLRGGRVLLGVSDRRGIRGLTRSDPPEGPEEEEGYEAGPRTYKRLEEWVMQACRDKIRPEITPCFEVFRDIEPGRDVAVVEVERGWNVHHVWHNQLRTYFLRVGSVSREASPEELARLFQRSGAFRPELRPVSGTSLADLDRRRLTDYFALIRGQDTPASAPSDQWRKEVEERARGEDPRRWKALVEYQEQEWREQQ